MASAAREILIGLALGMIAAGAWNNYKKEALRKTDAFYKQYDQRQAKTAVRKQR